MSDDDDVSYVRRSKVVHFGSLAEATGVKRQHTGGGGDDDRPTTPDHNVETSHEYMPLETDPEQGEKDEILEEFERRKRARLINVSTDDAEIKKDLRDLGEPICLFGEGPAERRSRLRDLLSQLGEDAIKRKRAEDDARAKEQREHDETTWYHEGPPELRKAREWIAGYSLPRAKQRIERQREELKVTDAARMARGQEIQKTLKSLDIEASQIADSRPVSWVNFSPNSKLLATGAWSGLCKVWSVPDCKELRTLRGHKGNIGSVVFHPRATIDMDEKAVNLASCDQEGMVNLWSMEGEDCTPLVTLPDHESRVSRCAFHPSGNFLATCVYDNSWRLFDVETKTELLHQEGHSKAVHCIGFQNDGSLACTGGIDSFGRVWDLRTGQCIMFLEGHLKGIIAAWPEHGHTL